MGLFYKETGMDMTTGQTYEIKGRDREKAEKAVRYRADPYQSPLEALRSTGMPVRITRVLSAPKRIKGPVEVLPPTIRPSEPLRLPSPTPIIEGFVRGARLAGRGIGAIIRSTETSPISHEVTPIRTRIAPVVLPTEPITLPNEKFGNQLALPQTILNRD